jgi:hypothetical protein
MKLTKRIKTNVRQQSFIRQSTERFRAGWLALGQIMSSANKGITDQQRAE